MFEFFNMIASFQSKELATETFWERIHDTAELVSLGLTVPTITMSVMVCYWWRKAALKAVRTSFNMRTGSDWLILGVWIAFAGSIVDNAFWGAAWTSEYLGLPFTETLFLNGVYFNIPARQMAGAMGGYCHLLAAVIVPIRAANQSDEEFAREMKTIKVERKLIFGLAGASLIAGVIVSVCLVLIKVFILKN